MQPDTQVGKTAGGAVGDGIYDTISGQTTNLTSKKARPVRSVVLIENDGEIPDDFMVSGTRGNGLFKVTYTVAGQNVTGAVTAGIHQTGEMNPGDPAHAMGVSVKPNKRKIVKKVVRNGRRIFKTKRKQLSLALRSESAYDSSATDMGVIKTKTK